MYILVGAEDTDTLGGSVEDRSVYGVENSSMFLECSPKSQRALIYWQLQKPNDDRKHEVCMFVAIGLQKSHDKIWNFSLLTVKINYTLL